MDLSIYTNFFADLPLETRLERIAAAGFRYCELDAPIPFPDARDAPRRAVTLRARADKLGLHLHQSHGYWGEYLAPGSPQWKARVSRFRREIAVAAELGTATIVAHPMNKAGIKAAHPNASPLVKARQVFEHNLQFFASVTADLERHGVKVAIENLIDNREGFTTIDELMELVDALDSDSFGICLDSGHLNQSCGDFTRFLARADKRLIATHMHDCLMLPGGHDLHLFPLFSSYDSWIDWKTVRDSLRGIGYSGTFNLETPGEGPTANSPLWLREKKLAFVFDTLTTFLGEPA
jgi:sugar phosphate isomerase/epimerase